MIASVGLNLPQDLLTATGRYVGGLAFEPERQTPRSGGWLESKFAPWARPVLESWAEGQFDDLDHVMFSRADDTAQRVYYYICELQRRDVLAGPQPLILDVAKIPRDISLERTTEKLREMSGRLGVGSEALEAAIVSCNARRSQAASCREGRVCLLAGTPPPDRRLHAAVEAAGFTPSGRTLGEEWTEAGALVSEGSGDPFAAVGRQLHEAAIGPRSFADPAEVLTRRIAETGARAVILWRIEEDEAQTWHMPSERRALENSGVPYLVLTRRDWLARDGAIEEISAFLDGVSP